MDFEGRHTRDLVTLARSALRDERADRGLLCSAAIKAVDNPPRDGVLRSLAHHVCQAVFDWACFEGSHARLQGVVETYENAANALQVQDRLNALVH